MPYTQQGRFMSIKTPLGDDKLLLDTVSGTESISRLYCFKLGMYSESETDVKFDELLGKEVTITLEGEEKRYLHGIISRLAQGQRIKALGEEVMMVRYEADMVPKFWLWTKTFRSRIFQQKTVKEILEAVLEGLDISWETQGEYKPRDYCVQYRESDFDFASRLMEEEGIFYFFKHTEDGHKMVITDASQSHVAVPGDPIEYEELHGGARSDERIHDWIKSQEIRTAKQTLRDHCFELTGDSLEAEEPIVETVQAGEVAHKFKVAANAETEEYDYPGHYAQRFDGIDPGGGEQAGNLQDIFTDNARTVKIRSQEEAATGLVITAHSDCRLLSAGHKFELAGHFNSNGTYVVTDVEHQASIEGTYVPATREVPVYANIVHCIPEALPFRPMRRTPKARVHGTQTAVVVGPDGDEIFTDKYGRVKVQFHWDRDGQNNADSSCWIRVATLWAGKQWGMIHIPRIGQEVIVAFEEGDPDQPIIVGSVYNDQQMPPYSLPDNKTQFGFKSRSSLEGDAETFNELRFEDKKDEEEIYFHAQKDFNLVVENNETRKIGNPDAPEGSQTVEIYKDRTETVKTGNETLTVEQGNREATITTGDDTTKVTAGNSLLEAGTSIELKVGGNSIKIEQSGITITATTVTIEGTGTLEAKSPATTVKGDGMLTLKGGVVMIN